MNSSKILTASIAVVSMVQLASAADQSIVITGSSAFRAAATNGILNIMTFPNGGMGYAYNGTSSTGASYQIFKGSVAGVTGTVTIRTNWSGSVQGIKDVAQGNLIAVLDDTTTVTAGGSPGAVLGSQTALAEVAFADNTQGSTPYKTPNIATKFKIGIVPFAFVAGQNTGAGVDSLTQQIADALFQDGFVPRSMFTGNLADTDRVYLVGRDAGSGTRLTAVAETGHGTVNPVVQYMPSGAVTSNTLTNITLTANGGDDGATSGGTVAGYLRYKSTSVANDFKGYPAAPISLIGYLGENDSYNAVHGVSATVTGTNAGNGKYLKYNGVAAFGGVASKPASVDVTNGSPVITLNSGTTAGVIPGQIVTGTGIAPGAVVLTVDSATQLTLDKNSTATRTVAGSNPTTNAQIGALLPAAIRNGNYSFWNYEYISWKSGAGNFGGNADKLTVGTALKNRILNFDYGFSGLADDSSMKVARTTDGGPISPNGN